MNAVENQLLTVFALLDWHALYQPFVMCVNGTEVVPIFYVPAIKLFVHYGSNLEPFPRMICWGETWKLMPNCPKPTETDTLSIREMLQHPALIFIKPTGRMRISFDQFKELPGSPASEGAISITRCGVCNQWSPQSDFSARLCRVCGQRTEHEQLVMLGVHGEKEQVCLRLINMDGESINVPEKLNMLGPCDCSLTSAMDGPVPLPRMTIGRLFDRLLTGPS